MKRDIDYKYTHDLYTRISSMCIQGRKIHDFFIIDGYNYWQFYEQRIFEDAKKFSISREYKVVSTGVLVNVKDFLANSFLLLFSLFSLIFFSIKKTKVVVYSIDRTNSTYRGDFRLTDVYDFLIKENVKYVELFHTVVNRKTFSNVLKRKRFSIFLESIEWLARKSGALGWGRSINTNFAEDIDLSNFTEAERPFVKHVVQKYAKQLPISKFKVVALSKVLPRTGAQMLVAIDDARYYYEILFACQRAGITTCAIQHGHFTKYHVGWINAFNGNGKLISPDVYVVWSEYWKKELLRLGSPSSPNSIITGGSKEVNNVPNKRTLPNACVVLIPYETSCPKKEVAEIIKRIVNCQQCRVIFKLRPDFSKERQLSEYGLQENFHPNFSVTTEVTEVISNVTLVAGVYSTFLYEMIAYNKPIAILNTSSDYGQGMVVNELATLISSGENICEQIKVISRVDDEVLEQRKQILFGSENRGLVETLRTIAQQHAVIPK